MGAEQAQILKYLRGAWGIALYAGYSYCRFRLCMTRPPQMGSCDLTDWEWVWPEGLAHYVEHHSVYLPERFIETMRSNAWQPKRHQATENELQNRQPYDLSCWIAWAHQNERNRWFVF